MAHFAGTYLCALLRVMWGGHEGTDGPAFAAAVLVFLLECGVSGCVSLVIPQISTHVHRVQEVRYELAYPPVRKIDANGHRTYHFSYQRFGVLKQQDADGDVTLHLGASVPSVVITRTTDGETDCRDAPGYGWLRHVVFWNPDHNCRLAYNRAETSVRYDFYLDARGVIG